MMCSSTRVDFDEAANVSRPDPSSSASSLSSSLIKQRASEDSKMGFGERAISAAGAAVLSAILVNPLDVAKVGFLSLLLGVILVSK